MLLPPPYRAERTPWRLRSLRARRLGCSMTESSSRRSSRSCGYWVGMVRTLMARGWVAKLDLPQEQHPNSTLLLHNVAYLLHIDYITYFWKVLRDEPRYARRGPRLIPPGSRNGIKAVYGFQDQHPGWIVSRGPRLPVCRPSGADRRRRG